MTTLTESAENIAALERAYREIPVLVIPFARSTEELKEIPDELASVR